MQIYILVCECMHREYAIAQINSQIHLNFKKIKNHSVFRMNANFILINTALYGQKKKTYNIKQ